MLLRGCGLLQQPERVLCQTVADRLTPLRDDPVGTDWLDFAKEQSRARGRPPVLLGEQDAYGQDSGDGEGLGGEGGEGEGGEGGGSEGGGSPGGRGFKMARLVTA